MNKKTRILTLILAIFVFIFPMNLVKADNDIQNINIKVELNPDGSAKITDHRFFQADSGTEHFLSFGNLGNIELEDYKVYDENGNELQKLEFWNVNGSLEEKAGKYGINYTSDGFELCFGIGKLGRREFTIEYTLSNFVFNTTDGDQAIYWKFLNEDMNTIHYARVSIVNNFGYTFEYPSTRIWGFGYKGYTSIYENELRAFTNGTFTKNDYMVLLTVFDGEIVTSTNNESWSTRSLIEQAMEGTGFEYEEDSGNSGNSDTNGANSLVGGGSGGIDYSLGGLLKIIAPALISLFAFVAAITALIARGGKAGSKKSSKFLDKREKEANYHRRAPEYNFPDLFSLLDRDVSDVISAFIIKWISEDKLQSKVEEKTGFFGRKKEELHLVINKDKLNEPLTGEVETELWRIVKSASGPDLILNQSEFNRYITKNISDFNSWEKDVKKNSNQFLSNNNLLEMKEVRKFFFKTVDIKNTAKGEEVIDQVVGFRKYLKEFSLLNERDVSFATIWGEFMVWAAYLGIAEEVYEQFKIVYPDFEQMSPVNTDVVILTNSFARSAMASQYSANNPTSSSGGGGSSFSGGGGGGSFGGGSGGGTR